MSSGPFGTNFTCHRLMRLCLVRCCAKKRAACQLGYSPRYLLLSCIWGSEGLIRPGCHEWEKSRQSEVSPRWLKLRLSVKGANIDGTSTLHLFLNVAMNALLTLLHTSGSIADRDQIQQIIVFYEGGRRTERLHSNGLQISLAAGRNWTCHE